MNNSIRQVQVIVIGAGTSGLMAAVNAAEQGADVLVIEKNKKPGRKLLLSGGGRCNVTNRTTRQELIKHIPGNGKFLYSALNQFDQEDIIAFFQQRGIELKEEDHGRMFPVTNKARTILEALTDSLAEMHVDIMTNSPIDKVLYNKDTHKVRGVLLETGEIIECESLVIAVGGRAYPKTGATGDGYAWARQAGHTIERLYPTESPLNSHDDFITNSTLQGISLRDVAVTLWDGPYSTMYRPKAVVTHQMDMIFTHFGYSGPAILRCSGHVNQLLHETGADVAHLTIDSIPMHSSADLMSLCESGRDKQLITLLKQWLPEKYAALICDMQQLSADLPYKQLTPKQSQSLFEFVKHFPITTFGSQPIEKGFVTGGGVSTKEIDPKTMESKLMKNLYFCGEILDINGYTGGYNITAAFVTGTIAGRNAAWSAFN